jgi:hypothetical protein
MASPDISTTLSSLITAHKQTLHLIHRLQRLPAHPGTYTSESDARTELSAEIHQNLKEQEEELELLKQEVEGDSNGGARRRISEKALERDRIVSTAAKLEEDLKAYAFHLSYRSLSIIHCSYRLQSTNIIPESATGCQTQRRPRQKERTRTPPLQLPRWRLQQRACPRPPKSTRKAHARRINGKRLQ